MPKLTFNWQINWPTILISLMIVFLTPILIQPLSFSFISFLRGTNFYLVNIIWIIIIKTAAKGYTNNSGDLTFLLCIVVFGSVTNHILSVIWKDTCREERNLISGETTVEDAQMTNEKLLNQARRLKRLVKLAHVSLIILFLLLYATYLINLTGTGLYSKFNQRVTILSKYIDDKAEKTLRSDWANMDNNKDYTEITKRVKALGDSLNIKF